MPTRQRTILFVIIDLVGGAGVFCRNLSIGLKRYHGEEFRTAILLCRPRGLLADDNQNFDEVRVLDIPVGGAIQSLRAARRIGGAIREIKPDLIIAIHTFANLIVPAVAPRGTPVILTVHTHLSSLMVDSRGRRILQTLLRLRFPGRPVVAPSNVVAQDLRDHFNADRVTVIPHGVDIDRIRTLATEPAPDLPAQPYLVACGRLSRAKDYPTLLRAYSQARAQCLTDHLAIIGDGEERASLESLARELSLTPFVHFLGHRDNPYPYLARARLFILSSITESFGLVLPEAMALRLPIVSTRAGGAPAEILRDGADGQLVPSSDPQALAQAIVEVTSSPQLAQSLSQHSSIRSADFSLRQMTDAYRTLIDREVAR